MSYFPQTTDNSRPQQPNGAPRPVRRAPNDFLDYNHGPDSYSSNRRAPDARRWSSFSDEGKQSQRQ